MFSFFRSNLPSRIVYFILLGIIIFGCFQFISPTNITLDEIRFMVIGNKTTLLSPSYISVNDIIAPYSSYIFSLLNFTVGKSIIAHRIFGLIIFLTLCLLSNHALNKYSLLQERTYISSLIMLILGCCILPFNILSPQLFGVIFLVLAFSELLKLGNTDQNERNYIFNIGTFIGFSALLHPYFLFFFIFGFFGIIIFSSINFKKIIYYISGFSAPFLPLLILYIVKDSSGILLNNLFIKPFFNGEVYNTSIVDFSYLIIPAGIFSVFSLFVFFMKSGMKSYELKAKQLMIFWILISILCLIVEKNKSINSIVIFLFPFSFSATQFLMNIKKRKVTEIITSLLFLILIGNVFIQKNNLKLPAKKTAVQGLEGKRILFLGNNIPIYKNNILSTSFLNWSLSKDFFLNINDNSNFLQVLTAFEKDLPEVIIDPDNMLDRFFDRAPQYKTKFIKKGDQYQLITSSNK